MQSTTRKPAFLLLMAVAVFLVGCAGSALVKQPDGGYERQSRSTMEQQAADALRKAGASTEAREAQKRAEKSREAEEKSPGSRFFADLLYSIFGAVAEAKSRDQPVTPARP
jgi:hypothetical protein